MGLAFAGGWEIGTFINEKTPVGDWIASGIDKITGLDKVGTNQSNQTSRDKSGNTYGK